MSCYFRAWTSRDVLSCLSVITAVGTGPQVTTMLGTLGKDNVAVTHSFVIFESVLMKSSRYSEPHNVTLKALGYSFTWVNHVPSALSTTIRRLSASPAHPLEKSDRLAATPVRDTQKVVWSCCHQSGGLLRAVGPSCSSRLFKGIGSVKRQ